jgi:tRNA threonylcarbamoyladenosine biosynthesis protein TsaB
VITLAVDASTYVGTAALFEGQRLLASGETAMRGRDAERLFPMMMDVVKQGGRTLADLGQIVCGSGPGSFTSLRIAASLAKGLAVGREIGIRPVPSLGLIVAAGMSRSESGRYLAVLDALRGEFYAQSFKADGSLVMPAGEVRLASGAELEALAHREGAVVVGPHLDPKWAPHARGALCLPELPAVDLATWEPDYGRKAEAQSRWEATHGRSLPV